MKYAFSGGDENTAMTKELTDIFNRTRKSKGVAAAGGGSSDNQEPGGTVPAIGNGGMDGNQRGTLGGKSTDMGDEPPSIAGGGGGPVPVGWEASDAQAKSGSGTSAITQAMGKPADTGFAKGEAWSREMSAEQPSSAEDGITMNGADPSGWMDEVNPTSSVSDRMAKADAPKPDSGFSPPKPLNPPEMPAEEDAMEAGGAMDDDFTSAVPKDPMPSEFEYSGGAAKGGELGQLQSAILRKKRSLTGWAG